MSKSDRERASRLRRVRREGRDLSDRDSRWLARYEAERPPRAAREPIEPATLPPPAPADDFVDLPAAMPAATPAPATATPATPNPAQGNGPAQAAATTATPQHAPGATCPVGPDCPGCRGDLDHAPKQCIKTGAEVYPLIGDGAARGFAGLVLGVIGWGIRLYIRIAQGRDVGPVAATELERAELADAIKLAFRQRPAIGWLGASFADFAAVANVLSTFGARQLNAPTRKPDEEPATLPQMVPA